MWDIPISLVGFWLVVILVGGLGVTGVPPQRLTGGRDQKPLWTFRTLNRVAVVISIALTIAICVSN